MSHTTIGSSTETDTEDTIARNEEQDSNESGSDADAKNQEKILLHGMIQKMSYSQISRYAPLEVTKTIPGDTMKI